MDGRVDGVKLDAIHAKSKDAGPRVAEARHLEAGDERRAVWFVTLNEPNGAVADRADDLAGGVCALDDRLQRCRRGPVEVHTPA